MSLTHARTAEEMRNVSAPFGSECVDQILNEQHPDRVTSPVKSLANDLLITIFDLILEEAFTMTRIFSDNYSIQFCRLKLVCKDWARLIDDTPALWSYVVAGEPSTFSDKALRLRQNHKLHVHARVLCSDTFSISSHVDIGYEAYKKIILPKGDRWGEAWITFWQYSGQELPDLPTEPALQLNQLSLRLKYANHSQNEFRGPGVTNVFGDLTPQLRFLTIEGFPISWESGLFKNLHDLQLSEMSLALTPVQLVRILKECPDLRSLAFSFSLGSRAMSLDDPSHLDQPIVELPRLTNLKLLHLRDFPVYEVVGRIRAPLCTTAALDGPLDPYAFKEAIPGVFSKLCTLDGISYIGSCLNFYGPDGKTFLDLGMRIGDPPDPELLGWLKGAIELSTEIKSLTIDDNQLMPAEYVTSIIDAFPGLTSLTVYELAGQPASRLLEHLSKSSKRSTVTSGPKPLPYLTSLKLQGCKISLTDVVCMLEDRYGQGGQSGIPQALENLTINDVSRTEIGLVDQVSQLVSPGVFHYKLEDPIEYPRSVPSSHPVSEGENTPRGNRLRVWLEPKYKFSKAVLKQFVRRSRGTISRPYKVSKRRRRAGKSLLCGGAYGSVDTLPPNTKVTHHNVVQP